MMFDACPITVLSFVVQRTGLQLGRRGEVKQDRRQKCEEGILDLNCS